MFTKLPLICLFNVYYLIKKYSLINKLGFQSAFTNVPIFLTGLKTYLKMLKLYKIVDNLTPINLKPSGRISRETS